MVNREWSNLFERVFTIDHSQFRKKRNRITERTKVRPFASLWVNCDEYAQRWSKCWTERRKGSL